MKYVIKEIMFNDIFKNMDQSVQFLAKYNIVSIFNQNISRVLSH